MNNVEIPRHRGAHILKPNIIFDENDLYGEGNRFTNALKKGAKAVARRFRRPPPEPRNAEYADPDDVEDFTYVAPADTRDDVIIDVSQAFNRDKRNEYNDTANDVVKYLVNLVRNQKKTTIGYDDLEFYEDNILKDYNNFKVTMNEINRAKTIIEKNHPELVNVFGRGKEYSRDELKSMGFDDEQIDKIINTLYGKGKNIYGKGTSLPADTIKKYGRMSAVAYSANNKVISDLEALGTTGWNIDTSLSDAEKKVLYKDNEVVVAYRGTSNTKDVLNDISLILKIDKWFSPRRSGESKHFKKVLKKYKGKTINLTGHSLGGKSVMNIMKKYPNDWNKAYMINGASVDDKFLVLALMKRKNDIYNIRTRIDPVSLLNPFPQVIVKQTKGDPHTVYNFT